MELLEFIKIVITEIFQNQSKFSEKINKRKRERERESCFIKIINDIDAKLTTIVTTFQNG